MSFPPFARRGSVPLGQLSYLPFPWTMRLAPEEARTHMHVLGVTGSGKSRFLGAYFLALLRAGYPVTLLDPHGDLSDLITRHLLAVGYFEQPGAFERLLVLDLPEGERRGRFLPLNVLDQGNTPHTTARLVLDALRRAWPSLDGGAAPTFENIVLAGVSVLIAHKLPLVLLHKLLVERPWREALLRGVADGEIVAFFHERFERWGREQPLLIESTLRRVFLLAFSPSLRYGLGQQGNALSFGHIFRERRSAIVNLALPDPDTRRLIGCLLTVGAEQAALGLSELAPQERPGPYWLIVDEFPELSARGAETFGRILALTRKFGVHLILAHQEFSQASAQLRGALANAGIELFFRLGRADAEVAAASLGGVSPHAVKHEVFDRQARRRTHPTFLTLAEQWEGISQELTGLPARHAVVRQASGGVQRITAPDFPDIAADAGRLAAVRDEYLRRYFTPQRDIERRLAEYRAVTGTTVTKRSERLPEAA